MNMFTVAMANLHEICGRANVDKHPSIEFKFESKRDMAVFETELKQMYDADRWLIRDVTNLRGMEVCGFSIALTLSKVQKPQ